MNTKRSLMAVTLVALSTTLFTLIATTKPLPAKAQAAASGLKPVVSMQVHSIQASANNSTDVRPHVRIRKLGVEWNIFMK